MTSQSLVDRFFEQDCTAYVRGLLQAAVSKPTGGSEYFTFDIYNVLVDRDNGSVTLEDELEANVSETVSIQDFSSRLYGSA